MRRIGKLKAQIDRWPVSDLPGSPQLLTIIVCCMYTDKPQIREIVQTLLDAAETVESGK